MQILKSPRGRALSLGLAMALGAITTVEAQPAATKKFPAALEKTHIDGLSIRYARAPRKGAPSIVLLSPWPESIFAFIPIWAQLTERYDVLALDLPGFGASEGRPEVIAPEAMGNFIVKAIRHFGLEKPHAVGPDVGTSSLLFAAANHPDAFGSISVGSGAVAYPLEVESSLKTLIELPSLAPLQNIDIAKRIDGVLATQRNRVRDFVRADYITSYSGAGRYAESARLVRRYPHELPILKTRLGKIQTPVLMIAGRHDPYVPVSNGHYLVEHMPSARLEILDAGHFVWEDASDSYGRLISEWVDQHEPRR
ncbi:MAG: alpha/beta fold hydrolase [Hyphomicrobiaceae bacterium]